MVHVTSRTIISIEKGQYNPPLMLAYRIAQIFNISVEGIFIILLGLVLWITIFITSFDSKKMIISTLSLLIGIGLLQRSLSRAMAIENKTYELDERICLYENKTAINIGINRLYFRDIR